MCSAASSITAKERPRFLQTPPLLVADCPLPRLRQPAEVVARSAGAARRRRYALMGLDHLAALGVGVESVFEGTAPGYKLEKTAHVDETADAEGGAAGWSVFWRR